MRFFFDNCVSSNLVEALRCLDKRHHLVHHREKFDPDTPDPIWGSRKLMTQASEMLRWWDDIIELSKKAAQGSGYLLEFKTKEPTQIYPSSSRRAKKR